MPRELIRAREVLINLVSKEVRVQYRSAVLGFLWAVLEPLAMTAVLSFVFTFIVPIRMGGEGPQAVLLLCAYLFWKFFADSLGTGSRSLVDNRTLIGKVNFPREVIPLASIGVALVNLSIGFVIFLGVLYLFGGALTSAVVWFPLVFIIQLSVIVGAVLLLSGFNAFYRDISYITSVALVFGFYATPIFYDMDTASMIATQQEAEWAVNILYINPMVGIVSAYRDTLVNGVAPTVGLLLWPGVCGVILTIAGLYTFRRNSGAFADHL